jgi:hypothetical protein
MEMTEGAYIPELFVIVGLQNMSAGQVFIEAPVNRAIGDSLAAKPFPML